MVGRAGKVAATLSIEKDWTKSLVLNDRAELSRLNARKLGYGGVWLLLSNLPQI